MTSTAEGKIAYKLFREKDGVLYPLYVNSNQPVPIGVEIIATPGPLQNGKVKSRLGLLKFRPGWHCSEYPIATHIGAKAKPSDSRPAYRRKNEVWAEVVIYGKDITSQVQKVSRIARYQCLDTVPNGYYHYKTNPNMFGDWMIAEKIKVNRVLSREEVTKINECLPYDDLPVFTV